MKLAAVLSVMRQISVVKTPAVDEEPVDAGSATAVARRFAEARKRVQKDPSEEQQAAGNYRKGHVIWKGFDLTIENPIGSTRSGVSPSGKAWETTMKADYGYFKRTTGRDGDHLDFFMGPDHESEFVLVVNQVSPDSGRFDEHKVILGTHSEKEARDLYLEHYEDGWRGLGSAKAMTLEQFREWSSGDLTKRAWPEREFAEQAAEDARTLATKLVPLAESVKSAVSSLPVAAVWYEADGGLLFCNETGPTGTGPESSATLEDLVKSALSELSASVKNVTDSGPSRTSVLLYGGVDNSPQGTKSAGLRDIGQHLGWIPGESGLGRVASPMTAMLATGLLGGGLGYGAGRLVESALPSRWRRGNLARTLATLGGLGGVALPAVMLGLPNADAGKSQWDSPVATGGPEDVVRVSDDGRFELSAPDSRAGLPAFQDGLQKGAEFSSGLGGPPPGIDVDSFLNTLWSDPNLVNRVSPEIRAATTGLLRAAQPKSGGLVGMADIGRLTAGIGTGWVAGAVVGKALGVLTGMPAEQQDQLRRAGVWAGVLNTVIPRAFGADRESE